MGSKHNYTEDDVRDLFLQRALLGDGSEPVPGDVFGIYGLEFDNEDPSCDPYNYAPAEPAAAHDQLPDLSTEPFALDGGSELTTFPPQQGFFDSDIMMHDSATATATTTISESDSKIPNNINPDDMTMIDPFLDFGMINS
jgi:hypothetical protein